MTQDKLDKCLGEVVAFVNSFGAQHFGKLDALDLVEMFLIKSEHSLYEIIKEGLESRRKEMLDKDSEA